MASSAMEAPADKRDGADARAGWARDVTVGALATMPAFFAALLRPLFHDEASTWMSAGEPFARAFADIRADIHPPLYPLLAWVVRHAGAPGWITLRVLSLVFLGAAVAVFLHALRSATGKRLRVTEVLLVTSPFLAFAGYFARYYTLAMLVAALALWAAVEHLKRPSPWRAAAMGVCAGALFLVNYLAAFTLAPLMAWAVWRGARGDSECGSPRQGMDGAATDEPHRIGGLACLSAFALCAATIAVPWVPSFVHQMNLEAAARAAAGTPSGIRTIPLAAAITAYNFAVGDGLPPWGTSTSYMTIAILSAVLALAAGTAGVWCAGLGARDAWRAGSWHRAAIIGAAAALAVGIVLGSLGLPGSRCVFLPPRAAFLYLAWLPLAVALPEAARRLTRQRITVLLTIHLLGLAGLLVLGATTVWAYRLPLKEMWIATADCHGLQVHKPGLRPVFVPANSLKNMVLVLRELGVRLVNEEQSMEVFSAVVISETSRPAWPPSAAVGTPPEFDPPGEFEPKADFEKLFVPEPPLARWLKERVTRRPIHPCKIAVRMYKAK